MLNLGDHSPRSVPGGRLILEAAVADQRGMARSAGRPGEQILDGPLEHIIGRKSGCVRHAPLLQRLVERRDGNGCVGADDDGPPSELAAIDDREEYLIPSVGTVELARPEPGGQAVAILAEDEERMIADGLEVAVVG